ncbi:TonB-dependent hemoglobin/transferrin/lactoferrin family receptor [Aquimonas sp.]|jgi:hemoglobin/transferrin/lactoferrin receptor protein|uniref:TonB-dependent hemoglobin/transferrin/lactoferrin family receptor n=1 Tax=Aquimonas sp. TaxID=1872588 RepID=UPI0037BFADEF
MHSPADLMFHRRLRPSALALALLAAHAAHSAPVPEASPGTEPGSESSAEHAQFDALERIVVSATLTESVAATLPSVISAIDRAQIRRELVQNVRDLVRYEPGVSVRSNFGRFGLGDFRIRGLEGNRVLIETDGIAVSDAFSIGSFANANRNFVDPATLANAEIVRGPGSSIYGSDALGGVVSFATVNPADLIEDDQLQNGRGSALSMRVGHAGEDSSTYAGVSSAFAGRRWSGLVIAHHRDGEAPRNQGSTASDGSTRTAPNPQNTTQTSLLAKLLFAPTADQRWALTVDGNEGRALTDVRSGRTVTAGFGAPVQVLDLRGDDRQTRARVALKHELDSLDFALADALRWQVYRQDSETTQQTLEERVTLISGRPTNPTLREREFNFDQRVYGLELTAHRSVESRNWAHRLTWGFELSRSEIRQKRDGRATNLGTGAVTSVISPDAFPVRDFPLSTTTNAAIYVQDEIDSVDSRWRLIPGLRIDRYQLDPRLDPIFAGDNPGLAPVELSETSVAPKFGVVRSFGERYSVFGGYARGFRSPPYSDVNLGFTNLQFGYTAIPNPELKPETSDGVEFGLRRRDAAFWWSASAYLNRYHDFIESLRGLGTDPVSGLLVFQSQNISRAEIYGLELKGGLALGSVSPALEAFELRFAAASAHGTDLTADVPLTSIDPLNGVLGLRWSGARADIELVARGAARKRDPGEVAGTTAAVPAFAAPGYAVLDLLLEFELDAHARLNVGVFNLADRHYWDWAAVPQIAASSTVLDRYSAAGRTLSAQLEVRF